jgi:hypothetical protein
MQVQLVIINLRLLRTLQVSLLPAITPHWAKERYNVGTKSVKVDALEYLPQEMDHLLGEMKTERENAKDAYLPAAFVTFK